MYPPRRILLIGASKKLLQSAVKAGVEVLSVQKPEQFKPEFLSHAPRTFLLDYEDLDALLPIAQGLYEAFPFHYVLSMTETGLIPAAAINDHLGLSGNSLQSVRLLKDKAAMRELLNREGISPVAAATGSSQAHIAAFAAEHGWPLIVKPVDGSGSHGIMKIGSSEELQSAWPVISELGLNRFIIEEYLDGPEISVEAFSFGGRHTIVGITDKWTLPNFVEIGHAVPSRIKGVERDQTVEIVSQLLTAAGIKEGPSHTELRLTAKGPRIIESHNRVGGDKIHDLVDLAYGIDMVELACSQPFHPIEPSNVPAKPVQAAAIRFFIPDAGFVTEVTGLEEVRNLDYVAEADVLVKPGDMVSPVRHSLDRVGYAVTVAPNAEEAVSRSLMAAQLVRIYTEEKKGEPVT